MEPGPIKDITYANGELYSRYEASVRGKHVFIVQSHIGNASRNTDINGAIMQQALLADAARSSSAAEITAVSPHFGYTRQERKSRGREPIAMRIMIDLLAISGVNRIVTADMHSPGAQAIFRGPFDHLTAQPLLRRAIIEEIKDFNRDDCMVIAPDAGASKQAERHRRELGTSMLYLAKMRDPSEPQKLHREEKVPEAEGRVCLVFDDMIDTAGTIVSAAEALKNSGAKAVYVAATHPVFSDPAIARLQDSPIDKILVTDTLPTETASEELGDRLRVVSIVPIIARAIIEIVQHGSISEIFDEQNYL